MAVDRLGRAVQHIRIAAFDDHAGLTDAQLLGGFIERRDESAFAALVRRHGPVVWGVCRRVLRHHHDAEDAFQATFLVLARKAAAIKPREMLANWLYGVAYRTALKARALSAKTQARERQVMNMPEPQAAAAESWSTLEPVLDQELASLPDKYRAAIVLCDLEGKTRKEVARQLKIPEGTVSSRLATAREMLAKRLRRRGTTLTAGVLGSLLTQKAAFSFVPNSVVCSTITAGPLFAAGHAVAAGVLSAKAAALTQGVLHAMLLMKLKTLGLLLLGAVVFAAGLLTLPSNQGQAGPSAPDAATAANDKAPPAKQGNNPQAGQGTYRLQHAPAADVVRALEALLGGQKGGIVLSSEATSNTIVVEAEPKKREQVLKLIADIDQLAAQGAAEQKVDRAVQGDWHLAWMEIEGEKVSAGNSACYVVGDTVELLAGERRVLFWTDATTEPKSLRMAMDSGEGIYKLHNGMLVLCFHRDGRKQRPADFVTKRGSGLVMMGFKRRERENPLNVLLEGLVASTDKERVQGTWAGVSGSSDGEAIPPEKMKDVRFVFSDDTLVITGLGDNKEEYRFTMHPTTKPKALDLTLGNREESIGIYELDGDTLKLCLLDSGQGERPRKFTGKAKELFVILKRVETPKKPDERSRDQTENDARGAGPPNRAGPFFRTMGGGASSSDFHKTSWLHRHYWGQVANSCPNWPPGWLALTAKLYVTCADDKCQVASSGGVPSLLTNA